MEFFGGGYDPKQDKKRLTTQAGKIFRFMKATNCFVTLADIEKATGAPQASASAALRAFRRVENGGHTVERKRRNFGKGTYVYRLKINQTGGANVSN